MNEVYEDDGFGRRVLLQETPQLIQEQYYEDKQTPASNKLQISPFESISQVGQKRLHPLIEEPCDSMADTQKRSNIGAESMFLQSSVSHTIVVGHTDASVVEQLR